MNEKWMFLEFVEIKHEKPKTSQSLSIHIIPSNSSLVWSHNQVLRPENSKEDTCGGLHLICDQLEG